MTSGFRVGVAPGSIRSLRVSGRFLQRTPVYFLGHLALHEKGAFSTSHQLDRVADRFPVEAVAISRRSSGTYSMPFGSLVVPSRGFP